MFFLIGGSGFLGSAFARFCTESDLPHAIITRANYAEYRGRRCDVLVNANGNAKKFLAEREPKTDFDASVRSVRASLDDFEFGTYVYLSSVDVYPDVSSPETTTEDQQIDSAHQIPYGFHKSLAEQCVQHAAGRWLIARLGGFVGPGLSKNAIFDVLHQRPLWVDPASTFQVLSTDQMARIVLELVSAGYDGEVFNVCGRGTISVAEIMDSVGYRVPVTADRPRVAYDVNISKLSRLIDVPDTPQTVRDFTAAEHWREEAPGGATS